MSAAGTWSITVESPMGAQESKVDLAIDGTSLTGTTSGSGQSLPIYDGSANGDAVSWKVDVTTPMPMTLTFDGKVSGDDISGDVAAGAFGSFPFTGTRG